ncbi:MAG TPA: tRNA-guanine transglycosylase, partial [Candidatus Omnitrophota bacterium]|nr:tRNA-guanine transglycosylase [Candidatus Omnitrophota bacterium]
MFTLLKSDTETKARRGRLVTAHGTLETPFFMPVGTNATVKGISAEELREMRAQLMLSNTYHLFL